MKNFTTSVNRGYLRICINVIVANNYELLVYHMLCYPINNNFSIDIDVKSKWCLTRDLTRDYLLERNGARKRDLFRHEWYCFSCSTQSEPTGTWPNTRRCRKSSQCWEYSSRTDHVQHLLGQSKRASMKAPRLPTLPTNPAGNGNDHVFVALFAIASNHRTVGSEIRGSKTMRCRSKHRRLWEGTKNPKVR